jgi:hypothetical protein
MWLLLNEANLHDAKVKKVGRVAAAAARRHDEVCRCTGRSCGHVGAVLLPLHMRQAGARTARNWQPLPDVDVLGRVC